MSIVRHTLREFEGRSYKGIVIDSKDEIRKAENVFQGFLNEDIILKNGDYEKQVRITHDVKKGGRITINDVNLFDLRESFKKGNVLTLCIQTINKLPHLILEVVDESASRIPNKRGMSPEEFSELQKRRQELGSDAESYVFEYEITRLRAEGLQKLANSVRHVSKSDIGAGYDILSYDLERRKKYIEVKARACQVTKFEWTRNEYKFASEVGEQYYIYFVVKSAGKLEILKKIKNPIDQIEKGKLALEPSAYLVTIR